MKKYFLYKIFQSHYCKILFLVSLILVSIVIPKKIFYQYYTVLGILFILISSLLITCFVRNIKDKIVLARSQKISFLGMFFLIIGFIALNSCTVGAPICGASIATGIISILFPGIALTYFQQYSIIIIFFSLIVQIVALYHMNCFKKITLNCE